MNIKLAAGGICQPANRSHIRHIDGLYLVAGLMQMFNPSLAVAAIRVFVNSDDMVIIRSGGMLAACFMNHDRELLRELGADNPEVVAIRSQHKSSQSVDSRIWNDSFGNYGQIDRENATVYDLRE